MMPKLSGFEVCKQIKDNPENQANHGLMVTALNELEILKERSTPVLTIF